MGLFKKPERRSVALIDIGSGSVGGAFAHFEALSSPSIYYTARVPIEVREGEAPDTSMLRALEVLGNILITHGAPLLRQETGSAHIDSVVASVAAPWQDTKILVGSKEEEKPFTFTHSLLDDIAGKCEIDTKGRTRCQNSVIATILNGYEVNDPFGKRTKRADLVILSSSLEEAIAQNIERALRKVFHAHEVSLTAFAPLSYAVIRDMYPHEKDFLIIDVEGEATDLAFVKRGLLADVASVPQGTNALLDAISRGHTTITEGSAGVIDTGRNARFAQLVGKMEEDWLCGITDALKSFSTRHALPRTIFLLADEQARGFLERVIDTPKVHSLWLSDEPLTVITLSEKHIAQHVKTKGAAEGDLFLAMMALYSNKQSL
ncbi:MAG TPA: hypothetical protein VEA92_01765 [Candidatus Paceibacterota bacterium]|nr:hypothetical protein [Candidatus Paceibacterota bacterium]